MYRARKAYFASVFLLSGATVHAQSLSSYQPIDAAGRVEWTLDGTVGPRSLFIVGPLAAGWETAWNVPKEWGRSWSGAGKRYLAREADVAISNTMEAGLGALWGEDPRYIARHGPRDPTADPPCVQDGAAQSQTGRPSGAGVGALRGEHVQQRHRERLAPAEHHDTGPDRPPLRERLRRPARRKSVG